MRASFRVLLPVVLVFVGTIFVLIGTATLEAAGVLNSFLTDNIQPIVSAVIAAGLLVMMGRYLDHRPIPAYGFRISQKWWLDFAAGLVIAGVPLTVMFVVAIGAGGATAANWFHRVWDRFFRGWCFLWQYSRVWRSGKRSFSAVVIPNAVEGLAARGLSPKIAILGACLMLRAGWVLLARIDLQVHQPAPLYRWSRSTNAINR